MEKYAFHDRAADLLQRRKMYQCKFLIASDVLHNSTGITTCIDLHRRVVRCGDRENDADGDDSGDNSSDHNWSVIIDRLTDDICEAALNTYRIQDITTNVTTTDCVLTLINKGGIIIDELKFYLTYWLQTAS